MLFSIIPCERMAFMPYTLTHPDHLLLTGPQGESYWGGNQDWYQDVWQRRAGCGPTTAAVLLSYLSRAHPGLAALAPTGQATQAAFLAYMEELWPYVTPGARGLDKAESLTLGCRSFALSRGCLLSQAILEIPAKEKGPRPTLRQCRDFVAAALQADCPVAFLNYSNGALKNLDSWHWVPLTAMTEAEGILLCTVLDEGEEKVIDLALWLETSTLGGALAALFPEPDLSLPAAPSKEASMIRLALPQDIDSVNDTYTELLLHEQEAGSNTSWQLNVYPTRDIAAQAQAAGTLYVMEEDGTLCASMILNHVQAEDYTKIPWQYPAQPQEVLVIHTLCIPPSQARKGLGRKMVQFALEKARELGCRVIRLDTSATNKPAARLYEGFGFRLAGELDTLHQGVLPITLIYFEKEL